MPASPRQSLLEIFSAALAAVNGRERVRAALSLRPLPAPVHLIAVGKAAASMALGAHDALGGAIHGGLVITKRGYGEPLPWPVIESSHPLPDAASLAAGTALLAYIDGIPGSVHVLVLLSGGASALAEALPGGMRLEDLQTLNEWLLASGHDIGVMNRLRKRLSLLKGGRLAQRLAPRNVTCLAISDVPGDDPRLIGSGPLVADEVDDSISTLRTAPADVQALLRHAHPLPAASDPCFAQVRFEIVARLADAKRAAAEAARRHGFNAIVDPKFIDGDALAGGARLARVLLDATPGDLYVWGGETTVRLPLHPGRGGRNQAMALSGARVLAGRDGAWLLCAGTDGTDGPTADAGALVDGGSIARGEEAGLDAQVSQDRADAGSFLEASGDLIQTGPTGTNVTDLILGLRG